MISIGYLIERFVFQVSSTNLVMALIIEWLLSRVTSSYGFEEPLVSSIRRQEFLIHLSHCCDTCSSQETGKMDRCLYILSKSEVSDRWNVRYSILIYQHIQTARNVQSCHLGQLKWLIMSRTGSFSKWLLQMKPCGSKSEGTTEPALSDEQLIIMCNSLHVLQLL